MAPRARAPRASTSKAAPPPPPKAAVTKKAAPRKRRAQDDEDEPLPAKVDSLGLGKEALVFGSEGEEEDEMHGDSGSEADQEEPFPEVDFGSSDDEEYSSGSGGSDDSDDESLGEVDEDEEAALLAELEAEDAELGSSDDEEDEPSDLDQLIRLNTTKPNEKDTPGTSYEDPELLGDYMRRSKTVISAITGIEKTEWEEEIEAGYGSDSSTEEVRWLGLEVGRKGS